MFDEEFQFMAKTHITSETNLSIDEAGIEPTAFDFNLSKFRLDSLSRLGGRDRTCYAQIRRFSLNYVPVNFLKPSMVSPT